ncbi:MAG: type II secretion system protein [Planctomycetota bacterium]|jgi:prepilin-type N-terminal cleavage/methylation domain-containing protein
MCRRKAFTLIELLVVIAVIALLLAVLMPSLRKAKDAARRISCGSRLKQWGTAINMHVGDNDGKLMAIVNKWGGNPYPHYINNEPRENNRGVIMWNIANINPYIRAFSPHYKDDGVATDMITCPTCSGKFMQEWVKQINWPNHDFVEIAYSYYGRVDLLDDNECGINAKKDLVGRTLSSRRLLMSEILNLDISDSAYRYNHGRGGWSWNELNYYNPSNTAYSPNPAATGRSQLFGDGHVEWRNITPEQNLPIRTNRFVDEWNGPGSGWIGTGDQDFY